MGLKSSAEEVKSLSKVFKCIIELVDEVEKVGGIESAEQTLKDRVSAAEKEFSERQNDLNVMKKMLESANLEIIAANNKASAIIRDANNESSVIVDRGKAEYRASIEMSKKKLEETDELVKKKMSDLKKIDEDMSHKKAELDAMESKFESIKDSMKKLIEG